MGLVDGRRKPLARLCGRTVLEHACAAFEATAGIEEIVVVANVEDLGEVQALCASSSALSKVSAVVEGGASRTDSVRAGVLAASARMEWVAIHDAARPLLMAATVEAALEVVIEEGAALVAIPATDTIKETVDGEFAGRTLDRSRLWFAQTPQLFPKARFLELLERAREDGFSPTDDAALWEHYVGPVPLVRGEASNLKLTTRADLEIARALLHGGGDHPGEERVNQRIGIGFDIHRLVEGRPCVLGGIELPHPTGPEGHSDGDAVLHAVTDAILGAAGLDDLGTLFPDDEVRWKGADSGELLTTALAMVHEAGWEVGNVDIVVITEGPRIAPHRAAMRERIAALLEVEPGAVNVKGKSMEGLGGGESVAVQASASLLGVRRGHAASDGHTASDTLPPLPPPASPAAEMWVNGD
jgi:2-C-methyl-D-erythritol 4-phosphate cytidylyltransferase / 2-C-methyl-D-erythritol 2,4-cyclodiphosphate synthase